MKPVDIFEFAIPFNMPGDTKVIKKLLVASALRTGTRFNIQTTVIVSQLYVSQS